jgi:Caenorhabditis protein of unknown function, DUF268
VKAGTRWSVSLLRFELRAVSRSVRRAATRVRSIGWYLSDHRRFAEQLQATGNNTGIVAFPQLTDRTATTDFDAHYVHQGPWVFRHLIDRPPAQHVDVASYLGYLGFFSAIVPTEFVDIRPPDLQLPRLTVSEGSVLQLPFADRSVESLSCLHVIEHIGLGRYGDPLDAHGSELACAELARVLAVGGQLYLSLPVGQPRIFFNAHRVHSVEQVLHFTRELEFVDLAVVLDDGSFVANCPPDIVASQSYACGMFRFTRAAPSAETAS